MTCIAKQLGQYVIDCYDQHGKRYRKTMKAGTMKDAVKKELREIEAKIEHRFSSNRSQFGHKRKRGASRKWLTPRYYW